MKIHTFLSLFLIAALLPMGAGAVIIKEIPQKYELDNFTETVTRNAWSTNIASMEAICEHPTWPHDIWEDSKGYSYISFYYLNTDSPKGYTSVYYDNYGNRLSSNCKLSLKLIEPYYGMNITEENTTDPIAIITPNETMDPGDSKPIEDVGVEVYNNTFAGDVINNNTFEGDHGSNITAENSTGVVVAHGLKNDIKQAIMDWTNVNLSNVNFYFWGN